MPKGSGIQPGIGMLPGRAAVSAVECIVRQGLRGNQTRTLVDKRNTQGEFFRRRPAWMVHTEIPGHRFIGVCVGENVEAFPTAPRGCRAFLFIEQYSAGGLKVSANLEYGFKIRKIRVFRMGGQTTYNQK
ncbi:MAG: hypothetical protein BWX80_04223 [Candidatus Hydrogenedentes bacterium ADurb.Bin101]|nr:MAG: hypothetical protein BWX80_04223 [Candidatus Hydrogenedentes bacterium ADurb.Bin101]